MTEWSTITSLDTDEGQPFAHHCSSGTIASNPRVARALRCHQLQASWRNYERAVELLMS
jgi:hypothetical protein